MCIITTRATHLVTIVKYKKNVKHAGSGFYMISKWHCRAVHLLERDPGPFGEDARHILPMCTVSNLPEWEHPQFSTVTLRTRRLIEVSKLFCLELRRAQTMPSVPEWPQNIRRLVYEDLSQISAWGISLLPCCLVMWGCQHPLRQWGWCQQRPLLDSKWKLTVTENQIVRKFRNIFTRRHQGGFVFYANSLFVSFPTNRKVQMFLSRTHIWVILLASWSVNYNELN